VQSRLDHKQLKERAELLSRFDIKKIICVTNKNIFEIQDDYYIFPVEIYFVLM
jgi:hypothetical protein